MSDLESKLQQPNRKKKGNFWKRLVFEVGCVGTAVAVLGVALPKGCAKSMLQLPYLLGYVDKDIVSLKGTIAYVFENKIIYGPANQLNDRTLPYSCDVGERIEDLILLNEGRAMYVTNGAALSHTIKVVDFDSGEKSVVFDPYNKEMIRFFGDVGMLESNGEPVVTIEHLRYAPTTERLYFEIKDTWFSVDLTGAVKLELNNCFNIPGNAPNRQMIIQNNEGTVYSTEYGIVRLEPEARIPFWYVPKE